MAYNNYPNDMGFGEGWVVLSEWFPSDVETDPEDPMGPTNPWVRPGPTRPGPLHLYPQASPQEEGELSDDERSRDERSIEEDDPEDIKLLIKILKKRKISNNQLRRLAAVKGRKIQPRQNFRYLNLTEQARLRLTHWKPILKNLFEIYRPICWREYAKIGPSV